MSHLTRRRVSAIHVELDGYLKDRPVRHAERISGYNPRATLFPRLLADLDRLLLHGEPTAIPYYDHRKGRVTGETTLTPATVVILDGIVSLHHEVRARYPTLRIFLLADDLVTKGLRLTVDMKERGYTIFEALSHVESESREYDRWIHHQSEFAHERICVSKERALSVGAP